MLDSNMRTVSVRFAADEHRLLANLAAVHGVSIETLVRDALTLAPIDSRRARAPALRIVRRDDARALASDSSRDHAAPLR
jgi:hypothetical protein